MLEGASEAEIAKAYFNFITNARIVNPQLPVSLTKDNPERMMLALKVLLPQVQQVQPTIKAKKLVTLLLQDIIVDPITHISQSKSVYEMSSSNFLTEQPISYYLGKLLSVPSCFLNMANDPKLVDHFTPMLIRMQEHTNHLYQAILQAGSDLQVEDKLGLTNRIIVLGGSTVLVNHCLSSESKVTFIEQNFTRLAKHNHIVKELYEWAFKKQNEDRAKKILQKLCKDNPIALQGCLLSLLNSTDYSLFAQLKYQNFHELFFKTKAGKLLQEELLGWWAVGRGYILTQTQSHLRTNLIALGLRCLTKEELLQQDYLLSLTTGIKKRLTDGSSKDEAMLVWKELNCVMKLTIDNPLIEKASMFIIKVQKSYQQTLQSIIKVDRAINKEVATQIESDDEEKQQTKAQGQDVLLDPVNIQDCMMGFQNPKRRKISLQKLPIIIRRHREDLVLMWVPLLRDLLCPLHEEHSSILALLFSLRPEEFIEAVTGIFLSKETNLAEKIALMDALGQGIEKLAEGEAKQTNRDEEKSDFYFKKVKSHYYRQNDEVIKGKGQKQERTRRWGHTRISHEAKTNGVNLRVVQAAVNQFYSVATLLYYKIVEVLGGNLTDNLKKHQVFIHQWLRLVSVFVSNIANYHEKYIILGDVAASCDLLIDELIRAKRNEQDRYEQTGGQTLMLVLQVLNKASLIVDQHLPQMTIATFTRALLNAKKLPNYGLGSVIELVENNMVSRVYGEEMRQVQKLVWQ